MRRLLPGRSLAFRATESARCQKGESSAHDAIKQVVRLLKTGHVWVVDADLRSYFDSIPQDRLQVMVGEKISDGLVLDLVSKFLRQGIMEDLKCWCPEKGTPQGGPLPGTQVNILRIPEAWARSLHTEGTVTRV